MVYLHSEKFGNYILDSHDTSQSHAIQPFFRFNLRSPDSVSVFDLARLHGLQSNTLFVM